MTRIVVAIVLCFVAGAAHAQIEIPWGEPQIQNGATIVMSPEFLNIDSDRYSILRVPIKPLTDFAKVTFVWRRIDQNGFPPEQQISWRLEAARRPYAAIRDLGAHPMWNGSIWQTALVIEGRLTADHIGMARVEDGSFGRRVVAAGQEFSQVEPIHPGIVNFVKGPMLPGMSLYAFLSWVVIVLGAVGIFLKTRNDARYQVVLGAALIIFALGDVRFALDQWRIFEADLRTLAPLSDVDRMGALGDPQFLDDIQTIQEQIPKKSSVTLSLDNEYQKTWGTYYLAPRHVVPDGEYVIVRTPSGLAVTIRGQK